MPRDTMPQPNPLASDRGPSPSYVLGYEQGQRYAKAYYKDLVRWTAVGCTTLGWLVGWGVGTWM